MRAYRSWVHGLSRLVFTGDSGAVRSAIVPEAIQIAVHQSIEKMPEHSVTNRSGLAFDKRFRRKHCVFARFVSVRLLRIPRRVLRFTTVAKDRKRAAANSLIERNLAPRARFELATLRLTAGRVT